MTFNENDVVRGDDGRFGEKPQSAPEAALTAWDAAVAHAAAFRTSEETAVAFIETNVPDGIESVRFEWSDQGDYLEVTGYTMADGTKLDYEGNREDGDEGPFDDRDLFDELAQAGRFIEAPADRGLEMVGDNADYWRLVITPEAHARPKVTVGELADSGEAAIESRHSSEEKAVGELRESIPDDVDHVVLECSDQGDFLCFARAVDADGNTVELDDDLTYDMDELASYIAAEAGPGAGKAGLEEHPDFRRRNPIYLLRRTQNGESQ